MKLSPNFSLSELIKSETGERLGLDNTPPDSVKNNLARICGQILEPVRAHYGRPFRPSSGYRSPEVNRAVGSKPSSQHVTGEAVDFEVPGVSNYDLACWVRDNLSYDQIILEYYTPGDPNSGWVHVSLKESGNRGNCLTINKSGTHQGFLQ